MSDRHLLHDFMTGRTHDERALSEARMIWMVRGTVAVLGAVSVGMWFL